MQSLLRLAACFLLAVTAITATGSCAFCQSLAADASQQSKAQLYFFTNPGCGPCQHVEPELEQLFREGYSVMKIDTTVHPDWTQRFQVSKTPTVVLVSGNQIVGRKTGFVDAATLREWFHRVGEHGANNSNQSVADAAILATVRQQPTDPGDSANLPTTVSQGTRAPANKYEELALQATVRLKVEDPKGSSYATGTVIHYHNGNALVLTCGHVFRDSNGTGTISAEYSFLSGSPQRAAGELLSFDAKARDIGLVAIAVAQPIQPVPIATTTYPVQKGDQIFSIGCDHGDLPTIRRSRVKNQAKYDGIGKYDIYGRPVDGRSGGGMFTAGGQLIGVCNAAVVDADEGVYVALDTIHWQIAAANLTHLFDENTEIAAADVPESPTQSVAVNTSIPMRSESRIAAIPVREPTLEPGSGRTVSDLETASEMRNVINADSSSDAGHTELIVVLRSGDASGQVQSWTINSPSRELVQQLMGLGQPVDADADPDERMARLRREMPNLQTAGGKDYNSTPMRAQSPR